MVQYNPARYGLTLQYMVCQTYSLEINETAKRQFKANFDSDYAYELRPIIKDIIKQVGSKPVKLLTFTSEMTDDRQVTSPHNFLLANGQTLSLRTTIGTGMVAPRTLGQAGFQTLNRYFSEIFDCEVQTQEEVRENIYLHIHKVLPLFIECFFPSDYNIIIERGNGIGMQPHLSLYKLSEIADYSFLRDEFTFTRDLDKWIESTTLKYHGISIAELQTHKNRTFKFRFKIKAIPHWFRIVKETTETFGITAEAAICDLFNLQKPESFNTRVSKSLQASITPIVKDAFHQMPYAIKHTGSEGGARGKASKCSYDFILLGNEKLSVKTNTSNLVCPPEVGQPGSSTCLMYFKDFLPEGTLTVDQRLFKQMVFENIEKLIPVYLSHLFDSDWLLWIYKKGTKFDYEVIHQKEIDRSFNWEREKFSFTKTCVEEWNESNSVKYKGITIGIFQVHKHRVCFKFRFNMPNILKLLRNKK